MRLKKIIKLCKKLNNTKYELWVVDKHRMVEYDKKYNRYKVKELFTKSESPKTIFISIYKIRRKK